MRILPAAPAALALFFAAVAQASIVVTPTRLTQDPNADLRAVASGETIVFETQRLLTSDIAVLDPAFGVRLLASGPAQQRRPAIDGNLVVYTDNALGNEDIFFVDVVAGVPQRLTADPNQDTNPDVSGNFVVYQSTRLGDADIFLFDLRNGLNTVLAGGPGAQQQPRIDGNTVVWQEAGLPNRVFATVIGSGVVVDVSPPGVEAGSPDISGSLVAYVINGVDVAVTDLATGTTQIITSTPVGPSPPRIRGELVAWSDGRNGNQDAFLYDLADGTEYQVTSSPAQQRVSDLLPTFMLVEDNALGLTDIFRIDFEINHAPIVTISPGQSVIVGQSVTLTGSANDPDGDPIVSVTWNVETAPTGSLAALAGANTTTASFTPDLPGQYIISFTASDGTDTSLPATVVVNASTQQYTGIATVPGGGVNVGDTISISFDYDSTSGFPSGSGPGTVSYDGAISNINILTTSAIPATVQQAQIAVANTNFFNFEGYHIVFTLDTGSTLDITLPFDIQGTSLALPDLPPQSHEIDLSKLGTVTVFQNAGIHYQFQENNTVQFARYDFIAVDTDNDGVVDSADNCPTVANPLQSNVDADAAGDLCDICPGDATDICNPIGSTAEEISVVHGGSVLTPDGLVEIVVDPGDLASDTTLSVTEITSIDPGVNLSIGPNPGTGEALAFYRLQPDGTQFANDATLSIVADVTFLNETQRSNIDLYRLEDTDNDGVPETYVSLGATCNVLEDPIGTFTATCTVQLSHFSTYAVVVPLDSDGDGVPNNFNGLVDACPDEDATGFDADNDGCIDTISGLIDLVSKLVTEGVISAVMENSLVSKVGNAESLAGRENICPAIKELEAFKNQVDAQTGKKISLEAAVQVKGYAESISLNLLSNLPVGERCS